MFQLLMLAIQILVTIVAGDAASILTPEASHPDASPPVDHSFPSFAFEIASFVEYAIDASGNPNTFSQNLMNAISTRTGSPPIIRVGGTSADFSQFVANQTEPALPVASQTSYQDVGGTTIGPSFWELFKSFPNASFVFSVPIGINNTALAVNYTLAAISTIGLDNIEAIEIGNEPDLYPGTNYAGAPLDPPMYQGAVTNESYVYTFGAFASAVSSALKLPEHKPIFQAFDTSHHFDDSEAWVLDVPTVFGLGINVNKTIAAVSHHYYQTSVSNAAVTLQSGLMNHAAIAGELDYFLPFIAYLQDTNTGTHDAAIPFVLGEVGNSLNHGNNYTYQNVLGSALWQVDFQLYALAIGVSRIYWQQIDHAGYDLWLPVESAGVPAQVFPNFYANVLIADFISNASHTRVQQLNISGSVPDYVVAYAAYDKTVVERIAVVNLNLWDGSGTRNATSLTITVPSSVKTVEVRTLNSADGAYANASSITYGGSQWTAASNGNEVVGVNPSGVTTYTVKDRLVTVSVEDSSAILVVLQRK